MKNRADLLNLINLALGENNETNNTWFINFSGHVNRLEITFYLAGWTKEAVGERCAIKLDKDGIQEAYWFIYNRITDLRK